MQYGLFPVPRQLLQLTKKKKTTATDILVPSFVAQ